MSNQRYWGIAYWGLLVCWIIAGILSMAHIRAGILNSYLGDLTIPAWLYIVARGLWTDKASKSGLIRWLGHSPEKTLITLFTASTITEISSIYWPHGIFSGTFDPIDLVAYATGLLICYFFDKKNTKV